MGVAIPDETYLYLMFERYQKDYNLEYHPSCTKLPIAGQIFIFSLFCLKLF